MSDVQLIVAAIITVALMLGLLAVVGYLQLRQIHSAVNSNMTAALNKIDELHGRLAEVVELNRQQEMPKRRK